MSNSGKTSERLFFALWPTATVRQHIATTGKQVLATSGGKPVAEENYHITLAFLGNVSRDTQPELVAAARSVSFNAFALRLDRCSCWSRSQIVWLGPTQIPIELTQLVGHLWTVLEPLGFKAHSRPFVPHVSIARHVAAAPDIQVQPISWSVTDFVLVKSATLAAGPVYTRIESFPAEN